MTGGGRGVAGMDVIIKKIDCSSLFGHLVQKQNATPKTCSITSMSLEVHF